MTDSASESVRLLQEELGDRAALPGSAAYAGALDRVFFPDAARRRPACVVAAGVGGRRVVDHEDRAEDRMFGDGARGRAELELCIGRRRHDRPVRAHGPRHGRWRDRRRGRRGHDGHHARRAGAPAADGPDRHRPAGRPWLGDPGRRGLPHPQPRPHRRPPGLGGARASVWRRGAAVRRQHRSGRGIVVGGAGLCAELRRGDKRRIPDTPRGATLRGPDGGRAKRALRVLRRRHQPPPAHVDVGGAGDRAR